MAKKTVCILGSSFIGAVHTAYREMQPASRRYAVEFYGQGNLNFPNVAIEDGWIVNARFSSATERKQISAYDALVIYADLPSPHELERQRIKLTKGRYTTQVIRDTLDDIVVGAKAFRLMKGVAADFGMPVFVVSSNVTSHTTVKMNRAIYQRNLNTILGLVGEKNYIAFPDAMFDEALLPHMEYYKGSIKLTGERADEELNRGHDAHHMNEKGGALILETVFDALDARL